MRIPCSVDKFIVDRYFPFVSFIIQIPSFRVARPIRALIDTGSPFTVISPRDALSFQLPLNHWQKGNTVSIAGFKFFRHQLEKAEFIFREEKGEPVTIDTDVNVLVPTRLDKKMLDDVKHIPTILGNDFLEEHKFALSFNPSSQITFLEKE